MNSLWPPKIVISEEENKEPINTGIAESEKPKAVQRTDKETYQSQTAAESSRPDKKPE